MQIRSKALSYGDISAIVRIVSLQRYDGNLRVHQDAHALYGNGYGMAGRFDVASSRGFGARRSWSGRRTTAACWHAFRDAYRAILTADPTATIVTSMARDHLS